MSATVIVGAGAAGLAVARQLQRRSIGAVLLEQGATGHVWGEHYEGLRLHTLKQVSALPCLRMPAGLPDFPPGEDVRDYLADYRAHFGLDVREGVRVQSATWAAGEWQIRTTSGDLTARTLVAATGIWSRPVRPAIEGLSAFAGPVIHSAEYRRAGPFAGRRVLVVGAGNSGSEIAVDLAAAGAAVAISVRSGVLFVPRPRSAWRSALSAFVLRHVPDRLASALIDSVRPDFSDLGLPPPEGLSARAYPVVGYELPEAVRTGRVDVVGAIDRFETEAVIFSDGSRRPIDAVVLATGFRPALDWLDDSVVRYSDAGTPVVDDRWRSVAQPTLSCVGFDYPNTEGWFQALGRVSKQAAAGVEENLDAV
ncbi:flavin-containing monooxygenase [Rhabdothermincola salaria]|uniref:flavin-containing monooxygenase n=1 Tax=Rhabdothermincola salaria TaxID=2903142 RepID=UPI001E5C327C|nr:NAD(P)/FAD-dependent oxidoreductase [Rhabdothermincola salaria]MCD9625684.1 NAD(P)/FAD-dependent oxidoreductase [Rhabdothermincola salaria]